MLLSQSFRSPQPLVDWFNHHFEADMVFADRVQPAYQALAARPPDGLDPVQCQLGVHHIGRQVDPAGERWLEEARAVARLARQVVDGSSPWSVVDKSCARAARYNDVCVLIPTRTNLRRLERAFQTEGVPYRVESGWLVLSTQEVRDLLSCLRAIDDPSDQVALVAALRSPAYACSDVDLLRWVDSGGRFDYEYQRPGQGCDGPVGRGLGSLKAFHDQRMDRSPAATAEAFVRDRMLAVQAFGSPHPRDALRRLRYVVAQARTLASSGQPTLRALCDWLESRQREQYYDAESVVPDADEDAVRFMTVHGSKGLEFPIVILTGLGVATSRVGPQSVDLVPNYETGVLEVRCGEFRSVGYKRDSEKTMYEAEQKRLLYVATTRARDHLVLSLYHGKDACHASRIVSRLRTRGPSLRARCRWSCSRRGRRRVRAVGSAIGDSTTPEQHRDVENQWLAQRAAVIETLSDQHVVSPSSLGHEPDPPPEPDSNNLTRRIRKGRGGSALGRAVHAVLQTIDLATLEYLDVLAHAAAREERTSWTVWTTSSATCMPPPPANPCDAPWPAAATGAKCPSAHSATTAHCSKARSTCCTNMPTARSAWSTTRPMTSARPKLSPAWKTTARRARPTAKPSKLRPAKWSAAWSSSSPPSAAWCGTHSAPLWSAHLAASDPRRTTGQRAAPVGESGVGESGVGESSPVGAAVSRWARSSWWPRRAACSQTAVSVAANVAYVGVGPRLLALGVSGSGAPTLLGRSPPLAGLIHRVEAIGQYAYVTTSPGGLQVVDVSDPANPQPGITVPFDGAQGLSIAGGYAYVAANQSTKHTIHIVNIADPTAPFEAGCLSGRVGCRDPLFQMGAPRGVGQLRLHGRRLGQVADPGRCRPVPADPGPPH